MTRGHLTRALARRDEKIKRLERLLAAEQAVSRALSELDYAPKQSAYKLAAVKRAVTNRKKLQ